MFGGHAVDIIFAQAGHIGPCARPEIARHIQYGTKDSINPDIHIELDATVKQTDISMDGDENIVSRYPAPNIWINEYGRSRLKYKEKFIKRFLMGVLNIKNV